MRFFFSLLLLLLIIYLYLEKSYAIIIQFIANSELCLTYSCDFIPLFFHLAYVYSFYVCLSCLCLSLRCCCVFFYLNSVLNKLIMERCFCIFHFVRLQKVWLLLLLPLLFLSSFDFRQRKTTQVERLPCNRLTIDQNTNVQSAQTYTYHIYTYSYVRMKRNDPTYSLVPSLSRRIRPVSYSRFSHFTLPSSIGGVLPLCLVYVMSILPTPTHAIWYRV